MTMEEIEKLRKAGRDVLGKSAPAQAAKLAKKVGNKVAAPFKKKRKANSMAPAHR